MKTVRAWLKRLRGQRRYDEIAEEFEAHLELQIADNIRAGMSPEEARRQALLKSGGLASATEAYADRRTLPFLEHMAADLRFSVRQLRQHPGYALGAVLVLTLGMAASLAIFAFVDAGLIQPIPYPHPATLVELGERSASFPFANVSYQDFLDWRRDNTVFQSLDAFGDGRFLLRTSAGTEPVQAGRASSNFFRTLGVTPFLGRDFLASEEVPGRNQVAILSYAMWQQRFGGNRNVVGRKITLGDAAFTIIGVLPKDFEFALVGTVGLWTTIDAKGPCEARRSCHNLFAVGRLKPGVSMGTAQANLTAIAGRLEREYPDSNRGQSAAVLPLSEAIAGLFRTVLLMLMAGATLLLLIAYVNVASLILLRAEGRRREVAVRSALGASVTRLATQFAAEALVLAASAALIALLLAKLTTQALIALVPADMSSGMPFLQHLHFGPRTLAYALGLACVAALLFTATPLLHFSFAKLRDGLTEGTRGSAGKTWQRMGSRLVVLELAMAMVLLAGSALLGKSLYLLLHVDLGLRPDHLVTFTVGAQGKEYTKDERTIALGRELVSDVDALPGVQSAALTTVLPVTYNGNTDWIRFVGKPYDGNHIEVNERDVSSEFFRTIGARLLRGRYFTDAEDESKPRVVIINETLAKKYFPGEDPIGKQIGDIKLTPKSLKTIIGVVNDIHEGALDDEMWPAEYHPFNQDPSAYFAVVARTSQDPAAVLPQIRPAIRKLHPELGVSDEATFESMIGNSTTAYLHRSSAWLVGGFAGVALLLAAIGLYSVVAYSVSQRTREIGIRMALGAEVGVVYRMILREAGWLAALGIAIGVAGSVGGATLARKMLFGVSSWDVPSLCAVAVVLAAAALAASALPARRASAVNPTEALRAE